MKGYTDNRACSCWDLKICWFFLRPGGTIKCRVSTDRHRRSRLEQGGAWSSLWTDLCSRQSEAIEEAQKDCIYTHTHTHTNNRTICRSFKTHKSKPQLTSNLLGLCNTTNCMVGSYTENCPNHRTARKGGGCLRGYGRLPRTTRYSTATFNSRSGGQGTRLI